MNQLFKINNFDLLRLAAASQVLLFHCFLRLKLDTPWWGVPLEYFPGVPIFFGISGYLISASYERSQNLKQYFRNRFLRIFPGLWTVILVTVLVLLVFQTADMLKLPAAVWLVSQCVGIIYTPSFLKDFGFGNYNGSIWTIPIELQFYVLIPLLYRLLKSPAYAKHRLVGVWLLFVAIAIVKALYRPGATIADETMNEKLIRYTFVPHFYMFLTGVLAQRFRFYTQSWIRGKGLYWVVFTGFITAMWGTTPIGSVLCPVVLIIGSISLAYTIPTLSNRLLRGTDISYGVYLYHGLLLNVMVELGIMHKMVYTLVVMVISCLVGYFSWIGIEKPLLQWKRQPKEALTTQIV